MHLIEAKSIHKQFQSDEVTTHVLRGIDLTIDSGEFVAIMGKSGAGKSTLLYQLSALDQPSSGNVYINGTDLSTFDEDEAETFRLSELGYVFQDYALITDLSIVENVLLPLLMRGMDWNEAHPIAEEALDSVGLHNRHSFLPSQLSGGEQQRTAIARAVAGKPKILFADEPTANLDSVSGRNIISLLTDLHKAGQTIVMVTHEEEYTVNCDRRIILEDGKILSDTKKQVYYPHQK